MSADGGPALSHCAALVRSQQPERYLATLFAPAEAREALFALYAFDHETGKVRQVVSEPMAGLIRLQWWRDALAAAAPPAHPVARGLHAALGGFDLGRGRLEGTIDAREREFEAAPPADLAALERHLAATSGAITAAALAVLGATDPASRAAGARIGLVVGLAQLLRTLPADLAQGRSLLPAAELARLGLDPASAREEAIRLDPVLVMLAARGVAHLQAARAQRPRVPKAALPALLPGTLAAGGLERLGRARHDLLARSRQPRPALAPLALLWRYATGRF